MRKYTLYQAAKYSKISRYKLEQAIREGILKTVDGKGNIKCFIYEDELTKFLDEYGDQYIRHDFKENKSLYVSPEINNFISKEIHEKIVHEKERNLQEKERMIGFLESQNRQALQGQDYRVGQLKALVEDVLDMVPSAKKSQIKDRLNSIQVSS